ncbi:hypothetical protein P8452_46595 [Trifolium repens]|nr:hypothetical protein P8452_46595 [Trifolium repens]
MKLFQRVLLIVGVATQSKLWISQVGGPICYPGLFFLLGFFSTTCCYSVILIFMWCNRGGYGLRKLWRDKDYEFC